MKQSPDSDRLAPWICALGALVLSGIAVGPLLSSPGANLTSLLRMTPHEPMAAIASQIEDDLSFVPAGHYDGVYYYAIAIDPLATGDAHEVIDLASHRYGHPGYGWLGWFASLGNPDWVPQALFALSLAGMAIAAFFCSMLSRELGFGPWGGAVVALNPGLLFSVMTDTSEAVTTALLAVSLWLWFRQQHRVGGILLAFLCFFKFQMLLVPVALGLWEIVRHVRGETDRSLFRPLRLLAVGPVLFLVWLRYLYARFGDIPTSGGPEFLSLPFAGWFDTMARLGRVAEMAEPYVQIASAQLPILVVILAAFVLGIVRSVRFRHPIDAVLLLQALFVLLLNWWNLFYPKDMIRALAIPLVLLIAVFFIKERPASEPVGEPL